MSRFFSDEQGSVPTKGNFFQAGPFLYRMRNHSWNCVKPFTATSLKEEVVELNVYPYSKVAKKFPSNVNKNIEVSLIKQVSK